MMLHWKLAVPIFGAPLFLFAFGYSNVDLNQDLSLDEEDPGELQGEVVSVNAKAQLARPVMRSEGNADTTKQRMSNLEMLQARQDAFEQEAVKEFERSLDGKWVQMTGLPTSQSSTDFEGVSGRATDGNVASAWNSQSCTHTKREDNAWWKVDLQEPYRISTVRVTNRADTVGWEIDPFDVQVDGTSCKEDMSLADGETRNIACPMVGDEVKIHAPRRVASQKNHWEQRRVLMICEVNVKATQQSLLERGSAQCLKHSAVASFVVTPNATDGECVPDTSSSVDPHTNTPLPRGFKELRVGRVISPGHELEATQSECEEQLLKSGESVRGAVWKGRSAHSENKNSLGTCHLLSGRSVAGAKHSPGAVCWRKLTCPKDMNYWRARAGLEKPPGSLLNGV